MISEKHNSVSIPVTRKASLDAVGITSMLVLCAIWGLQQVAIKVAIEDIPAIWQSGIRSAIAALLMGGWLWFAQRPWTYGLWLPGLIVGTLFACEFAMLYTALRYTDAARASLLLYTSPFVVAIGAHFFIRGEKLSVMGWVGVSLAFLGTIVMMQPGFVEGKGNLPNNSSRWLGDLLALGGGAAWGLTTLVIRTTGLESAPPAQTLFYQLWVSGVLLCLMAWGLGESFSLPTTSISWLSMLFQICIVASSSYLAWFVLVSRYAVTKLSVFGFLTPVFGSIYGAIFLKEVIGLSHMVALGLIIIGIVIVNFYGHHRMNNRTR